MCGRAFAEDNVATSGGDARRESCNATSPAARYHAVAITKSPGSRPEFRGPPAQPTAVARASATARGHGTRSPEVGVADAAAAGADGGGLRVIVEDDAGVRTEVWSVQIEPRQRLVVKW